LTYEAFFLARLTKTPPSERRTSHTVAGAFATRTRNTPGPTTGCSARYRSAISCLRSPALQSITGTPAEAAHARTRRANRPAKRIRWLLSNVASEPSCSWRHHTRNPPGLWPNGKYALSTIRSTQSYEPVTKSAYRALNSSTTDEP
jgi:hypothetical protein